MKTLASFLCGSWQPGHGDATILVNPATEAPLAQVHAEGYDLAGAVAFARRDGAAALAALTFAQRGELLAAFAKAIADAREELITLAIANGGNTRGDAKFDIDGASGTLSYYADLAKMLGNTHFLPDYAPVQVGRTARLVGQHVYATKPGVAVLINAFNFPAWGLAEKAATALLAGMPIIGKPATATCLVTHRVVELAAPVLPAGVLQLLCGSARSLPDLLDGRDVLAFTGSSDTAATLRSHAAVTTRGLRLCAEADSVNAAVLAPDVEVGGETWGLFLADVARDMTQKTGQKCTAIRRVLVPHDRLREVCDALGERLAAVVVGDPAHEGVRMGPVATKTQQRDVLTGIARLAESTQPVFGEAGAVTPQHVPAGKGYFVGAVLRVAPRAADCAAMHANEVFGPVATVAGYDGEAHEAAALVGRGGGSLVTSMYSDDRAWVRGYVQHGAAHNGRLYMGSEKMAAQSPGPGTALPQLLHGGPGRAGGGQELGGLRGLTTYMQCVALQGDATVIKALLEGEGAV
ncbi:MAG: 3,4-dehydroadipyl-CoA semialdehyde dehydrogenase [Myxococcales bacterium]|nr:3,4-dehydroadipyl-CoA semialdehyde dehydrogenase [Myxococcales bacterium]